MADWLSALNCPYCGARLEYARSDENTHVFRCWGCGPLVLPPDGRLRCVGTPPTKSTTRVSYRQRLSEGDHRLTATSATLSTSTSYSRRSRGRLRGARQVHRKLSGAGNR